MAISDKGNISRVGTGGNYYNLGAFNNSGTTAGSTGGRLTLFTDSPDGTPDVQTIALNGLDGSAGFGTGTIGTSGGVEKVDIHNGYGQIQVQSAAGGNAIYRGYNSDGVASFTVRGNGSADFVGGRAKFATDGNLELYNGSNQVVSMSANDGSATFSDGNITLSGDGNVLTNNAFTVQTAASTQFGVITYDEGSSTFRIVALNTKRLFCTSSGEIGTIQSGDDWIPAGSERRFKTDITKANVDDCWSAIKSIQISNFYYKEQEDKTGVPYLGPIVDELETTNPDLVIEFGESKSYNKPLLEMKAIQALQTALTRIEALEAQLTQLTGGAN
jgi:hypothetical protein